jgi:hypothetical protein
MNPWIEFLKRHGNQGWTRDQLQQKYRLTQQKGGGNNDRTQAFLMGFTNVINTAVADIANGFLSPIEAVQPIKMYLYLETKNLAEWPRDKVINRAMDRFVNSLQAQLLKKGKTLNEIDRITHEALTAIRQSNP